LPPRHPTRAFLIDTDTASDDAVALLMALRHPEADVRAITVVAGNVTLDQAVQNALYVRELAGSDVPVHAGAARPRSGPQHLGHDVHGRDGMGDIGLRLRGRRPTGTNAVEVLIGEIRARPGRVTLVTLGPLTNVAAAFEHVHVAVERRGELTRGQTVIDHRARFGEANIDVVFAASRDRFIELLHDSLRP
jgi:purine nucleosidase